MSTIGKELERQRTPDELAFREVESYVERVEKQTERYVPDDSGNAIPKPTQVDIQLSQTKTSNGINIVQKPNIVLPLDQSGVTTGLQSKVTQGVRWLAEWCVMMIKKYPGRVFYSPTSQT